MGHYCRICGRERPNEQFSGKGHRTHVCKQCARMPKEQRRVIEAEEEIFGFMAQTHLSDRNISRLQTFAASSIHRISELATPILEVVTSAPQKKRKKGRRSTVLTMSMRDDIASRWHNAVVLQQTDEEMSPGG
jgi:hypothetical protein